MTLLSKGRSTVKPTPWNRAQAASVEATDDKDINATKHGGHPKRSDRILELSDGSDNEEGEDEKTSDDDDEVTKIKEPEETAEAELGR